MPMPITVSELRTGNPNVGDNTILIAMRRGDARYLQLILDHYIDKGPAKNLPTKEICGELRDRMDECLPRS